MDTHNLNTQNMLSKWWKMSYLTEMARQIMNEIKSFNILYFSQIKRRLTITQRKRLFILFENFDWRNSTRRALLVAKLIVGHFLSRIMMIVYCILLIFLEIGFRDCLWTWCPGSINPCMGQSPNSASGEMIQNDWGTTWIYWI